MDKSHTKWLQNYKKVVECLKTEKEVESSYLKNWIKSNLKSVQKIRIRKKLIDNFQRRFGNIQNKSNKYHKLVNTKSKNLNKKPTIKIKKTS
jgi:hypothetical protein